MNVTSFYTVDYENDNTFRLPENKANTNPIQSQYKPNPRKAKMNVTSILTKDYENKRFRTPPKQTQSNPTSNRILQPASGVLFDKPAAISL